MIHGLEKRHMCVDIIIKQTFKLHRDLKPGVKWRDVRLFTKYRWVQKHFLSIDPSMKPLHIKKKLVLFHLILM